MPRLALPPRHTYSLLTARPRPQWPSCTRQFHASAARRDNAEMQNYYETLELPYTASAAEIKRQFYTLSKRHHPDRNAGDPASSTRFVRISEAYHTLGTPDKRHRYDRDLARAQNRSTHHHHSAHAAYAGPAGSRPASGLSRRRTQFRGPPPSFYRNGAWGAHGAKRAANAAGGDSSDYTSSSSSSSSSDYTYTGTSAGGGFGPGQAHRGSDGGTPHWDRSAHARTQEGIAARVMRARRAAGESVEEMKNGGGPWSLLVNFVVVGGTIVVVASIPGLFERRKVKGVQGAG